MRKRIECTGFPSNTIVAILIIVFFSTTGWCADKLSKETFLMKDYQNLSNHTKFYYGEKYTNNGSYVVVGKLINDVTYNYTNNTMSITWVESFENGDNYNSVWHYNISDLGQFETGSEYGPDLQYLTLYENPILLFPYSEASIGDAWGGGTVLRNYDTAVEPGQEYPLLSTATRIYQQILIGKEHVAIDAPTPEGGRYTHNYTNCLMVSRIGPTLHRKRIAWYAKGIGLVKVVYMDENYNVKYQLVPSNVLP